jgi:signal transduction histidine kinase
MARCLTAWLALVLAMAAWTAVAAPPEVVRVGVSGEFAPYYFAGEGGRYEGFVADLMERVALSSGLRFEYRRFDSFPEVLAALRRGEVDMTPFAGETPQRLSYLRFAKPMFATQTVVVADRRLPDLSLDETFSRYRVAVERDSGAEEMLRQHYPEARLLAYESAERAILAAATGEADLCVTFRQVAAYYMEKHFTANLVLRGMLAAPGNALGMAVRKDRPELVATLDQAVGRLSTEEIAQLAAKWLPRTVLNPDAAPVAPLTDAQRAWVQRRGGIRLGFDAAFAPISFASTAGGFDGMLGELTRLVAHKAGLIASYEQGGSFADVFEQARRGQLDLVVGAARNAERAREFDFVGPLLRVPTVIVGAGDNFLGDGLDGPGARRVALLRQHFLLPVLRSRHPALRFVEYDSQAEVLQAVRRGDADLAIGNMKVVNLLLEQRHQGALKTVGVVPHGDSELFFAVPKREPELTTVLRAALDATTPAERNAIEDRWLKVEFSAGIPWGRALGIAAVVLALGGGMLVSLWLSNRRLAAATRTYDAARRAAEEQVQARARFTAYLSHELRGTLGGLRGGLALMEAGTLPQPRVAVLTAAMRQSAATLLDLCERTLDIERCLRGGVDLQPARVRLAEVLDAAVAPWRVQAELKGIALRCEPSFDVATTIECDPLRLTQVVQNLVGNAVKFTQSGEVVLTAAFEPDAALPAGTRRLRLEVADTGPGIAPEDQAGIFEAFGQGRAGREHRGGAGLGLAIVAQIVAAMQGEVYIERSSPQGTVFVATLHVQG